MLKENKLTIIITSLIILIPAAIGILFWDRLPDVMATHFGFNNEANGFTGKAFTVIGIPLVMLAVHLLCATVVSHDPKRKNISGKLYSLILWIAPVTSLIMACVIYPYNLGYRMDMSFISGVLLGLMFVIIGNYLPKVRPNYTVGVRVPWTLANEENWYRTHRIAGYVMVIAGLVMLGLTFTRMVPGIVIFVICIAAALIPVVYSYYLHVNKGL